MEIEHLFLNEFFNYEMINCHNKKCFEIVLKQSYYYYIPNNNLKIKKKITKPIMIFIASAMLIFIITQLLYYINYNINIEY